MQVCLFKKKFVLPCPTETRVFDLHFQHVLLPNRLLWKIKRILSVAKCCSAEDTDSSGILALTINSCDQPGLHWRRQHYTQSVYFAPCLRKLNKLHWKPPFFSSPKAENWLLTSLSTNNNVCILHRYDGGIGFARVISYEIMLDMSSETDRRHSYPWLCGELISGRGWWCVCMHSDHEKITEKYIFLHASTLYSEWDELKTVINVEK